MGASLLPARAYHDEAVHAWEAEHVFFRDWIAVARAEEMPDQGTSELALRPAADAPPPLPSRSRLLPTTRCRVRP
ncbi:MAG: hypothetical protein ABIG85_07840 [Chloroflexota bacterium]